jgi:D-glycero-D-manno-heptose 1,7-bisphosphate phosphatase
VEALGGHIDGVFYCPHTPEDDCNCRKPKTGLIDAIESELGIPVSGAAVVGDAQRDLEAGLAKGCRVFLVKTGKGEKTLIKLRGSDNPQLKHVAVFDDLKQFATCVCA